MTWCPPGSTRHQLAAIRDQLDRIEQSITSNEEITMSGLSDLQANIAAMQAEWVTFLADVQAALANEDSDAAVEAASQLVAQQTEAMQAADPATPAPAPGS